MRAQVDIQDSELPVEKVASRRKPLGFRIDRLLREMSEVVAISPFSWREPLRLLLTHSRPPTALRDFQKNMRAAIALSDHNETFIDRLLAALDSTDRANGLGELMGPVKAALISFIGSASCRTSVSMAMVSKLIEGTDIDAPTYESFSTRDKKCRPLPIGKSEALTSITLSVQRAVSVILGQCSRGRAAFSTWTFTECMAGVEALWLAYTYCQVGTAKLGIQNPSPLKDDFERFGKPLWRQLDVAMQNYSKRENRAASLDLASALGRLSLSLEAPESPLRAGLASPTTPLKVTPEMAASRPSDVPSNSLMHVVCRDRIPDSSDKQDISEITRHRVLEQPLPVGEMPTTKALEGSLSRLTAEFPWALAGIREVFDELLGRGNLGVRELTMPATLLIGRSGAGKSRLARRIAEELGLPRLDVSLSGNSDTKLLGGTSRGWGSGRPSDLASFMARRETASAIVMLDEIDKAVDGHREGGGIAAYLLPLLEPETACRHYDSFLKTECDFSKVSWICTANRLSAISRAMQSRLRIILIPQPRREDLPVLCTGVIADLEQRWGMPSGTIPSWTELQLDLTKIASARHARAATEAAVSSWARAVVRH